MEETGLAFRPLIPGPYGAGALLAVGLLLCALAVLSYRRTSRPVPRRWKALLLALRFGALGVLMVCLLRPSLQTVHYEVTRRPLLLLVDRSDSMVRIADTASGLTRQAAVNRIFRENAELLEELGEVYDVVRRDFARGIFGSPAEPAERATEDTRYSAYGIALEQGFAEAAGGRCEAVVVFGDGSHNFGPPDPVHAAAMIGQHGVPVHTVGVGQDVANAALRDVSLSGVSAPRSVFLFSEFPVRAELLCRGCQGRRVDVELDFPGRPTQTRGIEVSHTEEVVPVEFNVVPDERGVFKLTVRAEPVPDELLTTNNSASTFVRVRSEGLLVGYYDTPRPESKFAALALAGAPQVQARRVLVMPGGKVPPQDADVTPFDVVVLGDIPPSAFPPQTVSRLRSQVQMGKGLVALPGERGWGAGGWPSTELSSVLPLRRTGPLRRARGGRQFRPAAGLADHPVLALATGAAESRRKWSEMPPLGGVLLGLKPVRAATVLATDQDQHPLLVVHRVGGGRAAALIADTTFRWFFTAEGTQDYHRRFWRQLVTWAAGRAAEPQAQVRLDLSKQRVLVEEPLAMQVEVRDAEGAAGRDAVLSLTITTPAERRQSVTPALVRGTATYRARYAPPAPGDYTVVATAQRNGEELGTDRALFQATDANPELEDPVANLKLLRRVSAATEAAGGRYYSYQQADELLRALKASGAPLKLTTRRRRDVWDRWPVFALFSALLATEWALRKWKGLI
ncbi:MAG: VWA domain-containing protein [Candidatus Brocadiia bacterium]